MLKTDSTKTLHPHHKYQLEVVFLFASGIFLLVPFLVLLQEYNLELYTYQWYFFWPWMLFYSWYSLVTRAQTLPEERVTPLKRPIMHWVLLGLLITTYYLSPISLTHPRSLDIAFIIFTLFLADSYWDFRNPAKS